MSDEIDQRQAELRQRARRRVIGVAVLATLLVVVVPRILERESQPVGHDIPVQMPARDGNGGGDSAQATASSAGRVVGGKIEPSTAAAPGVAVVASNNAGTASDSTAPLEAPPAKVAAADGAPAAPAAVPAAVVPPPAAAAPAPASAAPASAAPAPAAPGTPSATPPVDAAKPRAAIASPPEPAAPSPAEPRSAKPTHVPAADKPVAKVPSHKPESGHKGGILVQVGVFADATKARQLEIHLTDQGFNAHRETVATAAGTRTRVRVGPYASRAEADKAVARLAALHENALVVKP